MGSRRCHSSSRISTTAKGKAPSKGKGKGGKGRGGRGRGRGRGRGGHLDYALDDYVEGGGYFDYGFDEYYGGASHHWLEDDPDPWPEEDWPDDDFLYEDGEEACEDEDDGGAAFYSLVRRSPGRQGDLPSSSAALPSPPRFALLGRGLLSLRAGRSDPAIAAPIDSLPSPKALPSAATQRNVLHSPMRTLAAHVQNEGRLLVDVGGRGQCGPNTLSFQIGLLDPVLHLGAPDGPALRSACCKHIMDRQVQRRLTSLNDEYGFPMMLGPLVINTMLHWPQGSTDLEPSIENWCEHDLQAGDVDRRRLPADRLRPLPGGHPRHGRLRPQRGRARHAPHPAVRPAAAESPPPSGLLARPAPRRHRRRGAGEGRGAGGSCRTGAPPPPPCPPPQVAWLNAELQLDEQPPLFRRTPGRGARPRSGSNSEVTLEEDAVRRAIRLTDRRRRDRVGAQHLQPLRSKRRSSAGSSRRSGGGSRPHNGRRADRRRTPRAALQPSTPSVDATTQMLLEESLAVAQAIEEYNDRLSNGTDGGTEEAVVASLLPFPAGAPARLLPKYAPPPPVTAHAGAQEPTTGALPPPLAGDLSEQQALDEEWGEWHGGPDGGTEEAVVASLLPFPAGAPARLLPKYAPPPPVTAHAGAQEPTTGALPPPLAGDLSEQQALDEEWGEWRGGHSDSDEWGDFSSPYEGGPPQPELVALLRELEAFNTTVPPPSMPSELAQTRVRRVGFADALDHARPPGDPFEVMSRTFTSPDELVAFLASARCPPTELIGFEFSGAVLLARRAHGAVAISADRRPAEHDGLHYLGCVQDIVHLHALESGLHVPAVLPASHRRRRLPPLQAARWPRLLGRRAGPLVRLHLFGNAVLVEQPDTLFHHVLDMSSYPDADVLETSTSALGDADRKFLRLTIRNFSAPSLSDYDPPPLPRPRHSRYRDPDLRDRARSSWRASRSAAPRSPPWSR